MPSAELAPGRTITSTRGAAAAGTAVASETTRISTGSRIRRNRATGQRVVKVLLIGLSSRQDPEDGQQRTVAAALPRRLDRPILSAARRSPGPSAPHHLGAPVPDPDGARIGRA